MFKRKYNTCILRTLTHPLPKNKHEDLLSCWGPNTLAHLLYMLAHIPGYLYFFCSSIFSILTCRHTCTNKCTCQPPLLQWALCLLRFCLWITCSFCHVCYTVHTLHCASNIQLTLSGIIFSGPCTVYYNCLEYGKSHIL